MGVDYADFRRAFDDGPWRAYAGYGRATGPKREETAVEKAITGLVRKLGSASLIEAAFATVVLPPDGKITEFEYIAAAFAENAPQALRVVSAPVGESDALEVGLIAASRLH